MITQGKKARYFMEPDKNMIVFECPGCGNGHFVTVNGTLNESGASWDWNGSLDAPTFSPSLLVNGHIPTSRCHSFVRDGKIQFLDDCYHEMKGQTVEMIDMKDSIWGDN